MSDKIIKQKITETLEVNYMPYAMSVIISRAIPQIDGFKPAHRKLLYTMYKMGLLKGNRVKSADVVGQTMRLNPHGDGAIYETLVRLTRGNQAILHPFIDSKGNFGKQYSRDMSYAASRYTEVKLDTICNEIFKDIDKNTVEFIENYNGTMKEPLLFPTTYPNLLVTANQGIAVGMASNICSFNLKEVCDTTINFIKNSNKPIIETLKAPDFSTGGQIVYNEAVLNQIYETGKGSFKVRARYRFDKENSCIEIYEIPYTTTVEAIIDKIILLLKSGKIKDITDIRDETGLSGLKLTIDIKKTANPDILMEQLYSTTPLSDSFNCNFNILIGNQPKVMGIKEILTEWVSFRIGCIKGQLNYDVAKKSEKLELLEGLNKIILDIDKAISIIRNTESDDMVLQNLMNAFSITEVQAEYICEIKLRNLNKEYLLNRIKEKDSLVLEIAEIKDILSDESKIKNLICKQLKDISKQYGKPRQTEIIEDSVIIELPKDSFIPDYNAKLFLTNEGYLKKITLQSLRSASEQKLKDGDFIIQEISCSNKSDLLMFSDKFNLYKMKTHELVDTKASNMGDYIANITTMDPDERIIFITTTTDYSGNIVFSFENGKFAKIPLRLYETKVNRKKLVNSFSNKSPLVSAFFITEDIDVLSFRDTDKAALFNTSLIAESASKSAGGITVFTIKKNSKLSKTIPLDGYNTEDIEYYRISKTPSTGHFIKDKDLQEYLSDQF